ncbi:MAG TPA: NAD-dependent epimerase/dehydratase family protein [Candidatus Avipropionibacterium avicola]|uniref:NAD-dependent epimerase/dehydratase family protein n=1 Tax=Candidatus Avipropionibacterium avicola TaxID=2840701 RepID=A0A9D1KM58_9ACTN|nr:NAD-dependent epimerase/dehydratase family protein [Candidatus Avipropionibacterium avicola]
MTWTRTARQEFDLDPAEIWAVVGDPRRLPDWQPGWAEVELDGPVEVGTTGRLVPSGAVRSRLHRLAAGPIRIVELESGRRLSFEQPQPGGRWRFSFTVEPTPEPGTRPTPELTTQPSPELVEGRCLLTQQISYEGIVPGANGTVIGDELADFAVRCARLRELTGQSPAAGGLRVVIPGGTGLLGRHLAGDLVSRGHQVVVLTRTVRDDLPFVQRTWDGRTVGPWADGLFDEPDVTAVVNLAGASVGARPTRRRIAEFTASRVDSTRTMLDAATQALGPDRRLAAWVQASTTAIWGDAGERHCTESTPLPYGAEALPQMTGVASAWESAFTDPPAAHHHVLRTSLVLARDAELVERLSTFARVGLGGPMGNGRQWVSWIGLADWLAIVRACLGLEPEITIPDGVVVAASPEPVRNDEMMRLIRSEWRRPPAPPTFRPMAQVGGWVMGTDPALGLTGRHATSRVLAETGHVFAQPDLAGTLHDLWS